MHNPRVPIRPLLVLAFADLLGFGMLLPDVQLRAEALGTPGWFIGLALASTFIAQSACSPMWGRLSDRIGRKPVIIACTGFSAASMLLYARAFNIWVILGSRVLAGLGGANVAAAQASVSDSTSPTERTTAMGKLAAASSAGLILGPAIGGYLAQHGGPVLLGCAAASSSMIGLVVVALLMSEPAAAPSGEESSDVTGNGDRPPDLWVIFGTATVAWFALAALEGTFGRLLKHNLGLGQEAFGAVFAFESLLGFGVQLKLVGPLAGRLGDRRLLIFALLAQGAGLAMFPLAGTLPTIFIGATVYGAGAALALPALNGWVGKIVPPVTQGSTYGSLQSARSFGFMVGPLIGGALFDWRPAAPYALAAATSCLAAAIIGRFTTR